MTCQNCGYENSNWAKACNQCGQTLEHQAPSGQAGGSTEGGRAAPRSGDLQLERAEFENSAHASACAMCANPLVGEYYQVNDRIMCHRCCDLVRGSMEAGSPVGRGLLSIGAGLAAAIGGSILYYAILATTGYEFGLIAILVGWGVGRAVNWGGRGRGGWFYQAVAISLTYLAIVSAYVPLVVSEIRKGTETRQSATTSSGATATPVSHPVSPAAEVPAESAPPTAGSAFAAIAILLGILLAMPFLGGMQNIMGLVIIGIGLYEAWKANRRRVLAISGPHAITAAAAVSVQG